VKEIFVDKGKRIAVYDGLFDLRFRQKVFEYAYSSYFVLGWADGSIIENQGIRYLHSNYSDKDLQHLGIIDDISNTVAFKELEGYNISKAVLNLSTACNTNFVHAHSEDKVLLYYVNLEWKDGWHGETLFYSEDLKDIVFASPYTPGRIIAFDADIPHTIRPQSHTAVQYRFSLALILTKK
jgi:hypothetical protein